MRRRIGLSPEQDVATLAPDDPIRTAAQKRDELNVGALPICDGTKLIGTVTGRDIVVRTVSAGVGSASPVVNEEQRLIGIVSLGAVATNADGGISSTLGAVSSPSHPDR